MLKYINMEMTLLGKNEWSVRSIELNWIKIESNMKVLDAFFAKTIELISS